MTELAALEQEHPKDPTVMVYRGSLQLLQAAGTWAVWNKHSLASNGLAKIDESVIIAPHNLAVRFTHAETTWHLPFFYHRKMRRSATLHILPAVPSVPQLLEPCRPDWPLQPWTTMRILAEKRDTAGAR